MEKIIKDGKIAVIYSPGLGAGWYSWNQQYPKLLFDPKIVKMIENNQNHWEIIEYCEKTYPDGYFSGQDLKIQWLPIGTKFVIKEYDGHEEIISLEEHDWITA